MNLTICKKDIDEGKVIRNWERQCFPCVHARLVIARGITGNHEFIEFEGINLFKCPHIGTRYKTIGKDTCRSEPRERMDIVTITNVCILPISRKIWRSLNWQELQPPFFGHEKTEIAEIRREQWKTLLRIDVPSLPKPCPRCK